MEDAIEVIANAIARGNDEGKPPRNKLISPPGGAVCAQCFFNEHMAVYWGYSTRCK
jgi:hypothetical protein